MRDRRFIASLGLVVLLLIGGATFAHHSYLLTVQQLKGGLDRATGPHTKGFFLIDVRSPEEHAAGFIPGTDLNIDYREIKARHREIGAKPEDHIVVYCQSGHRGNIAAEILADLGYKHVYNVAGSMNAWQEAGYTVQFPKGDGS